MAQMPKLVVLSSPKGTKIGDGIIQEGLRTLRSPSSEAAITR